MTRKACDILAALRVPPPGENHGTYRPWIESVLGALPCSELTTLCRFFQCPISDLTSQVVRYQFDEALKAARAAQRKGGAAHVLSQP